MRTYSRASAYRIRSENIRYLLHAHTQFSVFLFFIVRFYTSSFIFSTIYNFSFAVVSEKYVLCIHSVHRESKNNTSNFWLSLPYFTGKKICKIPPHVYRVATPPRIVKYQVSKTVFTEARQRQSKRTWTDRSRRASVRTRVGFTRWWRWLTESCRSSSEPVQRHPDWIGPRWWTGTLRRSGRLSARTACRWWQCACRCTGRETCRTPRLSRSVCASLRDVVTSAHRALSPGILPPPQPAHVYTQPRWNSS